MHLEALATPAPFVYGGTFSDYVKEKKKFTRFSTLARFSQVVESTFSEVPACKEAEQSQSNQDSGAVDCVSTTAESACSEVLASSEEEQPQLTNEMQKLYAEARSQDIGTVDTIELPQCTMKVVNLVDIAKYIQQCREGNTDHEGEEEEEEEEEWESEEEEDEEEFDIDQESLKEHVNNEMKAVTEKAQSLPSHGDLCMSSSLDCKVEVDSCSSKDNHCTILESHLPIGSNPCQLIALATPPNSRPDICMYMALSDAAWNSSIASTNSGADVAAKTAATELDPGVFPEQSTLSVHSKMPDADGEKDTAVTNPSPLECNPRRSVHRFNFVPDEVEAITSGKAGTGFAFKDDGSKWIVDDSRNEASGALLHKKRRSQGSASSWGGGGAFLEPIAQGKLSLDQSVKIRLPKLPMTPQSADAHTNFGDAERAHFGPLSCAGPIF